MQTSFHIDGFWFHVNWTADGKTGIDQHGHTWHNMSRPVSDAGGLKAPEQKRQSRQSTSDWFLNERATARAFYINKYYGR